MTSNASSRTASQTAANLTRLTGALIRLIRGAISGGLHGAAAAAVKEALPFIVKAVTWILVVFVALPMLAFASLPSMFFGYESSDNAEIAALSEQAQRIGGEYLKYRSAEQERRDSVAAQILSEYEADGETIDNVTVSGSSLDDGLYWIIALSSVESGQDPFAVDANYVIQLSASMYDHSAFVEQVEVSENNETAVTSTLHIFFDEPDPAPLMDSLGLDGEQRMLASAMYELLIESDPLNTYQDHFKELTEQGDIEYGST